MGGRRRRARGPARPALGRSRAGWEPCSGALDRPVSLQRFQPRSGCSPRSATSRASCCCIGAYGAESGIIAPDAAAGAVASAAADAARGEGGS